jgi:signal transduction histidine kinase/ActR/RegA family two-component response regulator
MTVVAAAIAKPAHKAFYCREDMAIFNALEHPIYVFDILNKSIWWANSQAVKMWNADSLDSLLERDFASDMSEASETRMLDYLRRFEKGERARESWTMYPNGVRTTTKETCSGITIDPGHVAILCECDLVTLKDDIDHASLRGVEMLRHLPIAVSQFDMNGKLIEENPEALRLFGGLACCTNGQHEPCDCFSQRFVDRSLGRNILQQVQQDGTDCSIDAQQHTTKGPRWSAIKVRKSIDLVSQEPCILYSARDITEVINAKNEADRANMEKSEMLAVLAHEIRTPLHQVIGYIDLLARMELSPEQLETVRQLLSSTTSLSSVVNDVLDFTKLEAGKMGIERIPFDPCAVCAGCVETTGAVAEKKGLTIRSHFEASILGGFVMGDPNRIRQIILNLLSNAIKFTPNGGEITLTLKNGPLQDKEGDYLLTFSVKDTGMGIPQDQLQSIFNKYKQADVSTARRFGGTGLGLAICKSLSEAMEGSIGVQSELHKGTEFTFHVPVEVCDRPNTAATPDDSIIDLVSRDKLNVLVAEDNRVNQKLVASMLKYVGHIAKIVENGQEAVAEVERRSVSYDIVLMDVQMPVMDGLEATKLIRSKGWTKSTLPIIGLTASFQTAQLKDYQDIGMNNCIGKPVRMKALKEIIDITTQNSKLAGLNCE